MTLCGYWDESKRGPHDRLSCAMPAISTTTEEHPGRTILMLLHKPALGISRKNYSPKKTLAIIIYN